MPIDRSPIDGLLYAEEAGLVRQLIAETGLDQAQQQAISGEAARLVQAVRKGSRPGLMESFLSQYGLDTEEGLALMSLAEALLRVPDAATVDALIQDKVGGADWSRPSGHGGPLIGFSAFALDLTAKVIGAPEVGPKNALHRAVARLGEPVIRVAVGQAMRILGGQFVFGRSIEEALGKAASAEAEGWRFSYDMLGEAARTAADADRYWSAYRHAISTIAPRCTGSVRDNPGISIKLSALHPRYEASQRDRVMGELVPRVRELALAAAGANMGFNIDAEEADRLDLSLDVIEAVLKTPDLAGWDGFGVVVQAYGKRVLPLIDWLNSTATSFGRRIMVRLVKGAYWDAEIKRAQVMGLPGYPVFTRKAATDVSYIAAARRLLASAVIYPQFAGHNAHTITAMLHLAKEAGRGMDTFELQRLHGMGEALHEQVRAVHGTTTRIYAPVGPHKGLLAYLVRRLLENGANGSFVHQMADPDIAPELVAADPIAAVLSGSDTSPIAAPAQLFDRRQNSRGLDPADPVAFGAMTEAREQFRSTQWHAAPLIGGIMGAGPARPVVNPADPTDVVGLVVEATEADVAAAIAAAGAAQWGSTPLLHRAQILRAIADKFEANGAEFYALLAREAGKTWPDAIAELREAVDFLRYYADEAEGLSGAPRGVFACISPWNFPLAIFTGQIAAALAAGNGVLAKPAPQTPLIACRAVQLMHEAGVPKDALYLLPGGAAVGAALTSSPDIAGVAFTGSLPTARHIEQAASRHLAPDAPLIAETGGINAMVVDTTALPEQAVRDIVASAFQSAGQRCSALRVLYVQEEAAERTLGMLKGAMDELRLGDPWHLATDIGPVIDIAAREKITRYIESRADRIIHRLPAPETGSFVGPIVLGVSGIKDIPEEIFGPVLHVATLREAELDAVIEAINASGYGLTFGLHTRIAARLRKLSRRIKAGNIYVNRNQIGAVVGSQPFGGEGLSGTGPKAGGPHYLPRFTTAPPRPTSAEQVLPGPTGESNMLYGVPRGTLLCLGPTPDDVAAQVALAEQNGNMALVAPLDLATLETGHGFDAVAWFGDRDTLATIRRALAQRDGALIPLLALPEDEGRLVLERHVCVDTTAAGGNAALLAGMG